ncbi:MAG TPA: putative porin [Terriglobales bacterium]|nr:putative porin [Terriglobales bacterium]
MQAKSQPLTAAVMIFTLTVTLFAQSTSSSTAKRKSGSRTTPSLSTQVKELREAVAAQQQQIQQLMQQLQAQQATQQQQQQLSQNWQRTQQQLQQAQAAASEAQQKASAAEGEANAQRDTVAKLNTDVGDLKTNVSKTANASVAERARIAGLESLLGRFRFGGDVRIRGEHYDQLGVQDRNRARVRVRFGVDGKLNEDFVGGFALATGSLGDPTTTNETLTNVFDRKTIALDRGYITYNPVAHHWLSLTGGKFAYTWQRTSATFDPDLNPEGFNQKFSFDLNTPVVRNFTVQALQLLYNEVSGGQDSYALGAQVSARLKIGPWTTTPSFLSLKWNRPDSILSQSAFTVQATTTGATATTTTAGAGPFPVPGEGQGCAKGLNAPAFAPCEFSPNGMTNSTYVDSKGVPHFYSEFNYADLIVNNQITTGIERLPVNILAELETNLGAAAHPLDSKGKVIPGLGSQNKEYGFDFSVGQQRNKNDVQVGYAWYREEQDAAIASFVESDQRAPTNILQNRVYGLWRVRSNTVASVSWWHGRVLNTNLENNAALFNNWSSTKTISKAGQSEPYLNRIQFDLIYSF